MIIKNIIDKDTNPFCFLDRIFKLGFKIINWNHFRIKAHNGKPRIKKIIKIKGFKTALIEEYNGNRCISRFY